MLGVRSLSLRVILSTTVALSCRAMSSVSTNHRAAVAQLRSTSNKFNNLLNVARCAGWAKHEGAVMLFLPENFGYLGESSAETVKQAEPPLSDEKASQNAPAVSKALKDAVCDSADGKNISEASPAFEKISLLDGLRTIARESGLWISGGGMHVGGAPPAEDDEERHSRVYNTHVILNDLGNLECFYRKIHLFDLSIPGKLTLKESTSTAPGSDLVLCDSPIGRLGLSTCYDVRFPEQYIELVKRGAQVILIPSAFTVPTGSAHWHILLRARAIETQCYVIAAAQFGRHNAKRESYGHSLIVDPWGTIVEDAGGIDGSGTTAEAVPTEPPSIITCDVDLDLVRSTRQRMPVQEHRKSASFDES